VVPRRTLPSLTLRRRIRLELSEKLESALTAGALGTCTSALWAGVCVSCVTLSRARRGQERDQSERQEQRLSERRCAAAAAAW